MILYNKSLILLFVCFMFITVNSDERIKYNNIDGGYEGIVVAINKNISPENSTKIIQNLKTLFSHSSEFLYKATEGRSWLKKIILIVPETWPVVNATPVTSCFSDSHIRVGKTDRVNGDIPYTQQTGGCGDPGQYIYMSDNFIINMNEKSVLQYGKSEKQLIHEWAHFRYGVFDEHGMRESDKYPAFYLENGNIHPTSCSRNMSGWAEKPDGSKCDIYPDGTVDYDCEFFADNQSGLVASLMYSTALDSINSFCTHGTDAKQHNKLAPNPQNDKCDGMSTWDVIMNNEDFKNLKSLPAAPKSFEPEYVWRKYAKANYGKYVLVLDISGSMAGGRIEALNRASKTFIRDIPLNNYMGIITFSSSAQVVHPLVQIVNNTVRDRLAAAVPSAVGGGTGIGGALNLALSLMEKEGVEGSIIVLVTDGEENEAPMISTVTPRIISSGVKVNCLAVGPSASNDLEKLTTATKGRMDKVSDGGNAAIHIENIFSSFTGCEDDEESIQIINKIIVLDLKVTNVTVPVDEELGKNTVITIAITSEFQIHFNSLNISVVSSKGKQYVCGTGVFLKDDVLKRCQLKLNESDTGSYSILIQKNIETVKIQVNVKISSEARDPNKVPVSVNAWLEKIDINHALDQPTIHVVVKKGGYPVIDANVTAIIVFNDKEYRIHVPDSGNHDGKYITVFNKATGDGRYSVSAEVGYTNITKLVILKKGDTIPSVPKVNDKKRDDKPKNEFKTGDFNPNPVKPIPKFENKPLEPFIRITIAGSFKISNYSENHVNLETVNDLKVLNVREDCHLLNIQWTAADDEVFNNKQREIDIRVSKKREDLMDEKLFVNQTKVTTDMIKSGKITGFKMGSLQQIGVKLPDQFWQLNDDKKSLDIFLAIRLIDKIGNKAKISNIASAHVLHDLKKEVTPDVQPVLDITETFVVNNASLVKSLTIPDKYGVITEFIMMSDAVENFNFTLKSPDQNIFDEKSIYFSKNLSKKIARYHFEDAITGVWELTIKYNNKIKTFEDVMSVEIISSRRISSINCN